MYLRFVLKTCLSLLLPAFVLSNVMVSSVCLADEPVAEAEEHDSADGHDEASHDDASHDGEAHDADAHGDGHGDGHHETGVPGWKSDLALWSLITFVLFLFVLRKAAWGPLISGLDQREAGIRSAIAEAEENQRKSQAMLAEYEQKLREAEQTVAEMVAEAKRDAERTSSDIVANAQAEVEAMRERAIEDIAQAKDAALAEVFTSVNVQVAAATERVLGRALSDEDQERLVQEALAEI
jgi:F-type H+-transporting ATPase subunit b